MSSQGSRLVFAASIASISLLVSTAGFAIDGTNLKIQCDVVGEGIKTTVIAFQQYSDGCTGYWCSAPFYFHSNGNTIEDFYGWKGAENSKSPRIWFSGLSSPTKSFNESESSFNITLYPSQSFYDLPQYEKLNKAIEISNNQKLHEGFKFSEIKNSNFSRKIEIPVLDGNSVSTIPATVSCKIL